MSRIRASWDPTTYASEGRSSAAEPVTITGLTKSFGAVSVLRGVDLSVPAGALVALLDPSGCGKTTLLRSVAGLDALAEIAGRPVERHRGPEAAGDVTRTSADTTRARRDLGWRPRGSSSTGFEAGLAAST